MLRKVALLGVVLVGSVAPPDGCPSSSWTSPCSGMATCESLALAGLTCPSVAVIDNCKDVCASPCCITTTTTTGTFTMTSVTHTSVTATATHTTSTTATTSHTGTTLTETTVTHTATGSSTLTHTHTGTTVTETTVTTTTVEPAAAKITVIMAVKVEANSEGYMEDHRVEQAYMDMMEEITGLEAKMIEVEMAPTAEEGEITVTYLLTVPYVDKGNGLEAEVSIEELKSKLAQLDMDGLNSMLDQKMEANGVTDFSQEVQKVGEDSAIAVNGARLSTLGSFGMVTSVALHLLALLSAF